MATCLQGNVNGMGDQADWVLSGFADEVDPSLEAQIEAFSSLRIPGLDLRSVGGVNVLDLEHHDLFRIHDLCKEKGIHIQAIGSPVNKIEYDILGQGKELDRLDRAIKAAQLLNVKRIRLFTPAVPEGQDEEYAERIITWMAEQRRKATDNGLILILENDARYWSAYPENAKRLFGELGSPNFKAAFDFANTVLIGFRPMNDWFPWLLPHLDTLHIKDAIEAEHKIVPAGEGDAQIQETLSWLIDQGWKGPLTLEPHLQAADNLGGFSGKELFGKATEALRKITSTLGVPV